MKNIFFLLICLFMGVNLSFAQNSSELSCSIINKLEDSFSVQFEKVKEGLNERRKKEKQVILRLKNNSTCSIMVISSNTDYFLEKLPSNATLKDFMNRKIRIELIDGEFVPDFDFLTNIQITTDLFIANTSGSGDYKATLFLKGGNSLLFSVPFENFKKKLSVIIPFEFNWESQRGDTHHLIWFPYKKLPEELKGELKIIE